MAITYSQHITMEILLRHWNLLIRKTNSILNTRSVTGIHQAIFTRGNLYKK